VEGGGRSESEATAELTSDGRIEDGKSESEVRTELASDGRMDGGG